MYSYAPCWCGGGDLDGGDRHLQRLSHKRVFFNRHAHHMCVRACVRAAPAARGDVASRALLVLVLVRLQIRPELEAPVRTATVQRGAAERQASHSTLQHTRATNRMTHAPIRGGSNGKKKKKKKQRVSYKNGRLDKLKPDAFVTHMHTSAYVRRHARTRSVRALSLIHI